MNKSEIEKIGLLVLFSSGLAYGFSTDISEFFRYFVLSGITFSAIFYWINQRKSRDEKIENLEKLLEEKKVDERVKILENMLQESDSIITEQETILRNYEELLESASVKFPCNCGANVFDGIFKPGEVVEVVCDNCKSKYAVQLKFDSVLIAEPIEDLNIDKLIKDNVEV